MTTCNLVDLQRELRVEVVSSLREGDPTDDRLLGSEFSVGSEREAVAADDEDPFSFPVAEVTAELAQRRRRPVGAGSVPYQERPYPTPSRVSASQGVGVERGAAVREGLGRRVARVDLREVVREAEDPRPR